MLSNRQRQENIRFVKDHFWKGVVVRPNVFVIDCTPKKAPHENDKIKGGCEIRREGGTFYMEVEIETPITKMRKRSDLLYADFKRVIEYQHDESDESIQKKRVFYTNLGFDFEVRKVIDPIEEIKDIIDVCREIIKDYNFEDEILKGEARQNFMTIVEKKLLKVI
jgi:hypothetical protein